jgi:hypothetical protein
MFASYKPEIYRWYTSQTMSDSTSHGDESTSDTRNNILNSPFFKYGLPALAIVVLFIVYQGYLAISAMYGDAPDQGIVDQGKVDQGMIAVPTVAAEPGTKPFYAGMIANIAYTTGSKPFQSFTLVFESNEGSATLQDTNLGLMGYTWIAFDPCYGQLTRAGDTLHVYCKTNVDNESSQDESMTTPDQFVGFTDDA